MSALLDALVDILDLEPLELNLFRGRSPAESVQRVFGGQVAGQALVAAGRTVDGRPVHSLHAYFLRPGDPRVPIIYEVDRLRDGRSFTTRRVVAIQHGRVIFNLSASFHVPEEGLEHQTTMPDVPEPESLPTLTARLAPWRDELPAWWVRPRGIDTRYIDPPPPEAYRQGRHAPRTRMWFRADGNLPDDPLLHACLVAYASDMSLIDTATLPHALDLGAPGPMAASLDHAMWFHQPFRADRWLLYDQESPIASGARALVRGFIFTAEGRLAVSVVQEGLIRPSRERPASWG